MRHSNNLYLLLIASLLAMLLLAALSTSTPQPGASVSPLAVDRPTPTSEVTFVPELYIPLTLRDWSPLPTPTVRPTP